MEKIRKNNLAFTLIELLVVIAIIAILAAILMPVLISARSRAQQIQCLNNMRQWALAFRMYTDDNNDFVPEEGDTSKMITDTGSLTSIDNYDLAWYNVVPPMINCPSLATLYGARGHFVAPPMPNSQSLFSCPSAPLPTTRLGYGSTITGDPTPTVKKAFFMYGMNCRLCINWGTRAKTGVQQTKFNKISQPSATILIAELNPDATNGVTTSGNGAGQQESGVGPAQSAVSAYFCYAGHRYNTRANLSMCDGSAISVRTNQCWETQEMADGVPNANGATEWATNRSIYWYPSPTTPN
jgi:prepilin-type N-terminal cleavage/methylation domain-containing protein